MSKLTIKQEATNYHTFRHIETVRNYLNTVIVNLLNRAQKHDQSKLDSPEVELFTELTSVLAKLTYGSDEYNASKEKLGVALEHHYANNSHHPEHYPEVDSEEANKLERYIQENVDSETESEIYEILTSQVASLRSSVNNMSLLDHQEMIVDWKAASERHNDGNILKSVEINAKRFHMCPQLVNIYRNTIKELFN